LVPVAFGPRIDSERDSPFLPDDPEVLVSRKQFNQVPMIVGLTKDEGSLFSASKNILFIYLIYLFQLLFPLNFNK
jgi:carboxylesterase type B